MDLGLDIVDGIGGLDLKGDGLARKGLDEDLHDGLETWNSVYYINPHLIHETYLDTAVFLNLQQVRDRRAD